MNKKCKNKSCTIKECCKRFTCEANPIHQEYGDFKQIEGDCKDFITNKKTKNEGTKPNNPRRVRNKIQDQSLS